MIWVLRVVGYAFVGVLFARVSYMWFSARKRGESVNRENATWIGAAWPLVVAAGILVGTYRLTRFTLISLGKVVFKETEAGAKIRLKKEEKDLYHKAILTMAMTDQSLLSEDEKKLAITLLEEQKTELILSHVSYSSDEHSAINDLIYSLKGKKVGYLSAEMIAARKYAVPTTRSIGAIPRIYPR